MHLWALGGSPVLSTDPLWPHDPGPSVLTTGAVRQAVLCRRALGSSGAVAWPTRHTWLVVGRSSHNVRVMVAIVWVILDASSIAIIVTHPGCRVQGVRVVAADGTCGVEFKHHIEGTDVRLAKRHRGVYTCVRCTYT